MSKPSLTPLAESLPSTVPFVGPEATERQTGTLFQARIGANESVFGPSPNALRAMADAATEAWKYPDPESHDLRHALAAHHRVASDEVVVGEGIDGLLGYVVRLFAGPGDAVVTSDGAYPTFNYHVAGFGAELHAAPYVDDKEDPASLIQRAQETNAKLIYFANPDNPMGTWHSAEVVSAMIEGVPENCLLVLDEAYIECAPAGTAPALDTSNPKVLRMRTFSKAYGMAGARVGYAIGHRDVIRAFERVRNHFGMTRVSQAGALAALADQDYLNNIVAKIDTARVQISEIARKNGLPTIPSATNFVTLDCGADGAYADAVLAALVADGIFVRKPFAVPGNRCIRISCGTDADLALFAEKLPLALATAKG